MLLLLAARVSAQPAATVPASSPIYDRLESVTALFPTRGVHLGQRPLSRRELRRVIQRIAAKIDSTFPARDSRRAWARRELFALTAALGEETDVYTLPAGTAHVAWRGEVYASDATPEWIPSNGLGAIGAITHPFAARRDGWPALRGTAPSLSPTFVLDFGQRLAVLGQPRFSLLDNRDSTWSTSLTAHRVYGRGVLWNVALQVGSDERLWGQSPIGAMFISGNALPLPALALGTDTSITLPWLFRIAGPLQATIFVSDLGRMQDPAHAKLAGWQVSIQPVARFELGVAVLAQTGGEDCEIHRTCAPFWERVVDLFPVIDALAPQHADLEISNKLAGGNLRLRFPELSGLDLYYELQIDDFDGRRLRSSLIDDSGHLLGLRLPMLVGDGQVSWRAEWHRTSLRQYEHAQYVSGVTYRERVIGDPIGPHAVAGYLSATWQPSPETSMELALGDERRDPSLYQAVSTGPRDRDFRFERVTNDPEFRRTRATLSVERWLGEMTLRSIVGFNRAWRPGGRARDEWMATLGFGTHRFPTF